MSEVKVNKISPRTNCGTVQLGDSGDTITIPAGATITNSGTQTGFGRTGTVDWNTTKKTANFDATNGDGFFVDTGSGAITATLPASPSAGNIVAFSDYDGNFATANLTIGRNGSNINGEASDLVMNKNNSTVQLIYVDATEGWRSVLTGNTSDFQEGFVTATGGTITCSGNFRIHTFTGPGTFQVTSLADDATNNAASYIVVAGGGGGGACGGGGGGAGGFREFRAPIDSYTVSPLNGSTPITLSATSYPITVGGGGNGASSPSKGDNGNPSVFSVVTSTAGGGGGRYQPTNPAPATDLGQAGGSGGGSGGVGPSATMDGGAGNSPPVSPSQGNPGGQGQHIGGCCMKSGGGGGATGAGGNGANQTPGPGSSRGGTGGAGATTHITGAPLAYAGGGGGAGFGSSGASAGSPCGTGGTGGANNASATVAGTTNRGGGGGGGAHSGGGPNCGSNGGSGVVVIRYKKA